MNRVSAVFDKLRKKREKAFICFITLGYPDLEYTEKFVLEFEKRGVDIVELGIPFSDPLADGPVIQEASYQALKKGVNLKKAFEFMERIRKKTSLPIVFMGYYNPVFKFGEKDFIEKALEVGVDGLILADLPPEEAKDLLKISREKEFSLIFLLTPVSSSSRIKLVCKVSDGFIYCVSYTGITGEKKEEKDSLVSLVKKVRLHTNLPLCVGFGISSPLQAKDLSSLFDGVIVGSAVIRKIKEKRFDPDMVEKVGDFVSSLVQAVK